MSKHDVKDKKTTKENSSTSSKIPNPLVNKSVDELIKKNKDKNYQRWIMYNKYMDELSKNHDEINGTTKKNSNTNSKNSSLLSVNKAIDRLIEKLKGSYYQRKSVYDQRAKANSDNMDNISSSDNSDISTSEKSETQDVPGVTVITSTIRPEYINAVFKNYNRQTYEKKEFIIVLNKNSMDIHQWKKKAKHYPNVRVFQLDEKVSFGECYNFCVEKSKYDYIAPFDDDDYYAPNYLYDIVEAFQTSNADVVGKKTRYIYFKRKKLLAISDLRYENCYVDHIDGPTLSFNKKIFDRVQFTNKPVGIDGQFCKDCVANGIKMYSTNRFNHVYIRHSSAHNHTWKISDKELLKWCDIVGEMENYQEYVAK